MHILPVHILDGLFLLLIVVSLFVNETHLYELLQENCSKIVQNGRHTEAQNWIRLVANSAIVKETGNTTKLTIFFLGVLASKS